MKLKKIASLMLAGIMAVSMLAGCKTGTEPTDPETPATPVTGVAATVNNELDENAEKISFTDNKVVEDLLVKYYTENPVDKDTWTKAGVDVLSSRVYAGDPRSAVEEILGSTEGMFEANITNNVTDKHTVVEMYILNSEYVTKENALRMVGQRLDDVNLPKENADQKKDYSYTGTIAAIEAESKGGTESVWVIVASITQAPADK